MSDRSSVRTGASQTRLAAWPASRAPSSGIAISKAEAVIVGYAGNAGQDGEAIGEARVGFDNLEDCGFDGRDLPIDLLEFFYLFRRSRRLVPKTSRAALSSMTAGRTGLPVTSRGTLDGGRMRRVSPVAGRPAAARKRSPADEAA